MKKIPLTQGKFAIVDDCQFEELNKYSWCVTSHGYAKRGYRKDGKQFVVYMHRVVAGCKKGLEVDHINHNKLDNRAENLRVCTSSQNKRNIKPYTQKQHSKYKGVSLNKRINKWRAYIKINRKQISLGMYFCEIEAAKAYDKKAKELFGEHAYLNFA